MTFDRRGDTDFEAVSNSCISITPLHIDLTNYASIQELKKWRL
jgi:5'-nucleotidase